MTSIPPAETNAADGMIAVRLSRGAVKALLIGMAILASAKETVSSESVSLTTYYPAPSGVYQQLMAKENAYLATSPGAVVGIGTTTPLPGYELDVESGGNPNGEYVNGKLTIGGPGILYLKQPPYIMGGQLAGSSIGGVYYTNCLFQR